MGRVLPGWVDSSGAAEKMKKKSGWTENTRQKGFPKPHRKWSNRCALCLGRGEVFIYWPRLKIEPCEMCKGKGKRE